jgi:hypothetical protein
MSKGVAGATALVLLWIAFVAFYVALHPGGIRSTSFVSDDNPNGLAQNPRDVIIYFIQQLTQGNQQENSATNTTTD